MVPIALPLVVGYVYIGSVQSDIWYQCPRCLGPLPGLREKPTAFYCYNRCAAVPRLSSPLFLVCLRVWGARVMWWCCTGLLLEEVNDCVQWMYPFALVISRDGPVAQRAFPGVSFVYEIGEHVPNSLPPSLLRLLLKISTIFRLIQSQ